MNPLPGPRRRVASQAGPTVLVLLLAGLETLATAHQPARSHAVMGATALVVCLCTLPGTRIPPAVRAAAAALISLTGSALLIAGPRPPQVWGLGEGLALLLLLAAVIRRAPGRTAAVLGPLLGLACVLTPLRDLRPGVFTVVQAVLTVVVAAYSLTVPRGVELRVANDGGAPARLSEQAPAGGTSRPEAGGGFGLAGLTERAEAMGGRLTAGPAPEGGWELTAVLPLDGGATA
ncbi:hypothetical protein OHU45_28340 [Streptomyces tubercidicus]|uniref:hypothetical protein n=1 Tax=Streptomyces tubercidicus TaxID=47759 RepID=UPI0030E55020